MCATMVTWLGKHTFTSHTQTYIYESDSMCVCISESDYVCVCLFGLVLKRYLVYQPPGRVDQPERSEG